MASTDASTADYRGHNIAIHPSGTPDEALTDAFMVMEPSANPMFTRTLYAHPRDQRKTYATQEQAREAALALARAWIDARLDKPVE